MSTSILLALILIVSVAAAFFVLHALLRDIPRERVSPRERYRWPVWNWYPLVVVSALLVALAANIYFTRRAERASPSNGPDLEAYEEELGVDDRQPVAGEEEK